MSRSISPGALRATALAAVALMAWAGLPGAAQAQSLPGLYAAARQYDANFLSAQAQYQASLAKAEQAKAGLRPTASLGGSATFSQLDSTINSRDGSSNSQTVTLSGTQPLYRPANRIADEQAQKSLESATAVLDAAEQDLIVRTAQAYFDVLAAQDNLDFVRAQKTAVSEQLAFAKRNFEVGTSTITDTREAQARFDLVVAQEIAAENDLRVKRLALDQLVGKANTEPTPLPPDSPLPPIEPEDVGAWVDRALARHPSVRAAQAALEVAQLEVRKAQAALKPTVDAIAQYQIARAPQVTASLPYVRNQTATVGVQFNWPFYTGDGNENRIQEALALEDKARSDLEAARRTVSQATRSAFFGVVSGQGQVRALQAAEASSQSALEANKLGYQVGVRINIDVLNAQSQLFQTKASLAKARYDVMLGGLRLRQASGGLTSEALGLGR